MPDTALALMGTTVMDAINSGTVPKAHGNAATPEMPNSGNFRTKEGILTLVAVRLVCGRGAHRPVASAVGRAYRGDTVQHRLLCRRAGNPARKESSLVRKISAVR